MNRNQRLIAGAVAGLAVAGGGAAIAANHFSRADETQAIVNDAAKRLGVQPSALSEALKQAFENRVDAAVAAGRLTKAQGDAIKQRIEAGDFPFFGFGPGLGGRPLPFGPFATLDAAASYLGLTEAQLRSALENGKTLAEVAKSRDKSVDGLVQALLDAAKQRLDDAVAAGRLTKSQEQSILSDLRSRITDFVNGAKLWFDRDRDHGFRGGPRDIGPFAGPGI